MQGDQPISWLMFFTFAAAIFIMAGAFIYFLRSRHNRHIAQQALAGDDSRQGTTPNGAFPELAGIAVFGLIAMALLAGGYKSKSPAEKAQAAAPVGGGIAQTVGTAEQPKIYQSANPSPDLRIPPASSTAGSGPDNAGRPENASK